MAVFRTENLSDSSIFFPDQIRLFTHDLLRSKKIGIFNPESVLRQLEKPLKILVSAIDIGGSKIVSANYLIDRGFNKEDSTEICPYYYFANHKYKANF